MEDFGTTGAPQLYTQDGPPDAKRPMNDLFGGENLTTEEYPVPDAMVGLIIGRGGDQITKIQADSGCRVAVVPQSTGGTTRPCTVSMNSLRHFQRPQLTGNPEQIAAAKKMLQDIIARGSVKEGESYNGHPAPSANELMNQNVAATASIDGNVMVCFQNSFIALITLFYFDRFFSILKVSVSFFRDWA